ncbi:RlmE family RNA methyltransferase [archaeon]|nr:MAG: RlmE family RNA methyltransferase [archaeon]
MRSSKCIHITIRNRSSAAWINRHVNDGFVRKAVKENMRSRSAYKLEEIQLKHKIIKPQDLVLDLGAAPGGWSLVASGLIKQEKGGLLVSLDLLPMEPVPYCTFIQGDFQSKDVQSILKQACGNRQVNVILSDMLHNVTGQKSTDHFRSMDLVRQVLTFSTSVLEANRSIAVCKYLRGEDERDLLEHAKTLFKEVKSIKPSASRSESAEAYLIAKTLIKNS